MSAAKFVAATALAVATFACSPSSKPSALVNPSDAALAKPAPDSFRVAFETNKGRFVIQAFRAWAPNGADRFYYLSSNNYYDGVKFFRNIPDFMVQFGIHGDPAVNDVWRQRPIQDDPVKQSNQPGFITYAMGGPNTRDVQLFINKRDNGRLDAMGFAPFGRVVEGMEVVKALNEEYGEGAPGGRGPDQERIQSEGNVYLNGWFPKLDSVVTARVVKD
jgi:cyclophilin family peptidyl-prolyl cis-trans isomerase